MKRVMIVIAMASMFLLSRNANAGPVFPPHPTFTPMQQGTTDYVSIPGAWTATISWEVYDPGTVSHIGTSSYYAYYYIIANTMTGFGAGSITNFNLGNPLSMPIYSNSWLDTTLGITPSSSSVSPPLTGQVSWTFNGIGPSSISDMLYIESTQPGLVNGVLEGGGYSDSHEIPGPGYSGGGTNPVPEPATMSLLGLGLAGLFLRRKK